MAATSANPVILNVVQIHRSDCIVTATVYSGEVTAIARQWKGDRPAGGIELPEGQKIRDGEYILPLTRARNQFTVTPTRSPEHARVVYPLTEDTQQQLEALLKHPAH